VRDGVHDPLLDERVFEQVQAPALVTVGRGAAHQGDQVRFAAQQARLALLLLPVVQGRLHRVLAALFGLGEALTDAADGRQADFDLGGDVRVRRCAPFSGFIGEEQDAGAFALAGGLSLRDASPGQFLALLRGEGDMIGFRTHQKPPNGFPLFYHEGLLVPLPRISVIIPTCHRNDLLAKCLDCLAPGVQTLLTDQYEVIVTDDGSKSTAELMVREQYPWVRWVAGPRRGPAANRNNGARMAKGKWLAFTDDDCLPESGWLEAYSITVTPDWIVYEGRTLCKDGLKSPLSHAPVNYTGGYLWSCNFMISEILFQEIRGFDEEFASPAMEDVDLRERLKSAGYPFSFVADAVVDHPPRRMAWGKDLASLYESHVQFIYKQKGGGSSIEIFNHLLIFRMRSIKHAPLSYHSLLAVLSHTIELWYVARNLRQWRTKYKNKYRDVSATQCKASFKV